MSDGCIMLPRNSDRILHQLLQGTQVLSGTHRTEPQDETLGVTGPMACDKSEQTDLPPNPCTSPRVS